jgi:hypothetical protein
MGLRQESEQRRGPATAQIAGAGTATLGMVAVGVALVIAAAPADLRAWLIANGADPALPLFVLLVAGAILWSFGAMTLGVTGWRWNRVFAALTAACGLLGLAAGCWVMLAPARFEIIHAAGGCAVLAGAVLTGSGAVASALARRVRSN